MTLIELDSQYQALFGSEVHTNNRLPTVRDTSTTNDDDRLNDGRYKDVRNRRKRWIKKDGLVRNKRGIYEVGVIVCDLNDEPRYLVVVYVTISSGLLQ